MSRESAPEKFLARRVYDAQRENNCRFSRPSPKVQAFDVLWQRFPYAKGFILDTRFTLQGCALTKKRGRGGGGTTCSYPEKSRSVA